MALVALITSWNSLIALFVIGLLYLLIRNPDVLPPAVSYYLLSITYFFQMLGTSLFIVLLWPFMYSHEDPHYLPRWVFINMFGAQRTFGLRVNIRGKRENFSSPVVLVCNHQSSLDLIPTFLAIPKRTGIVSKKELLYAGTFGMAIKLCEGIFIDRVNRSSAHATMQKVADKMRAENLNVWVYAEGTRNRQENEAILPFKKGAFHLAIQAGVPIVPVVISSYLPFYNRKRKVFRTGGTIIISFLPPVDSKKYSAETVGKFTQDVHDVMTAEFQKISAEAGANNVMVKAD